MVLSHPFTTPVWVVRAAAVAKVPVTSLRTKCALNIASGGLLGEYLNPLSVIFIDLAAPILVVVDINLTPEPEVVSETLTVGSLVYPAPPLLTKTFCIEPDSVDAESTSSKVSNSKTI